MMNHEKILEKIKELNSLRAKYNREFKEIQKKHINHEISDKDFNKHESSFHKNFEKLRIEIKELEHQLNKLQTE